MTSVADALAEARRRGVAGLDAQLLLARALGTSRTGLIAGDDRVLAPAEERSWTAWLGRRAAGEPLAYLLGEKEFFGLMLEVSADVLVPRPETELLVDWASERIAALQAVGASQPAAAGSSRADVVDLGTGSGAIALALKHRHRDAAVSATDASPKALAVARRNAARLGLAVEFVAASWWHGLEGRRFDVVVANPPYVGAGDPHLAELRHEPIGALSAGADGLDALRAIVAGAPAHLRPGGWLLVEHGFDQGDAVRALLAGAGLTGVETRNDLAGRERASGARRGDFGPR